MCARWCSLTCVMFYFTYTRSFARICQTTPKRQNTTNASDFQSFHSFWVIHLKMYFLHNFFVCDKIIDNLVMYHNKISIFSKLKKNYFFFTSLFYFQSDSSLFVQRMTIRQTQTARVSIDDVFSARMYTHWIDAFYSTVTHLNWIACKSVTRMQRFELARNEIVACYSLRKKKVSKENKTRTNDDAVANK